MSYKFTLRVFGKATEAPRTRREKDNCILHSCGQKMVKTSTKAPAISMNVSYSNSSKETMLLFLSLAFYYY